LIWFTTGRLRFLDISILHLYGIKHQTMITLEQKAATKALHQISKWTGTLNFAWEDVEID